MRDDFDSIMTITQKVKAIHVTSENPSALMKHKFDPFYLKS